MNQFFQHAAYTPSSNPRFVGNAYVEALGDMPSDAQIARKLTRLPKFHPDERSLDGAQRVDRLGSLQMMLVPLDSLVCAARAICALMRNGYEPRKPYSKSDNERVRALFHAQKKECPAGLMPQPTRTALSRQLSMALIGASGCGKSYGLSAIASMFPQVIFHEQIGRWQLPFVFVEMSHDGESVHTLASQLFGELDRLLPDAGYMDLYMYRKGLNAEQRLMKALALCYEHGVGMLVVDEAQNKRPGLKERESKQASVRRGRVEETGLTRLLITASNTSHIPVLFSGTLEVMELSTRMSLLRRLAGNGSRTLAPLTPSANPAVRGDYEMLWAALVRYQWVRKPVDIGSGLSVVLHELTQGVPDLMVKLWIAAQTWAISSGQEELTPQVLRAAFSAEFGAIAVPLELRRNGQTEELAERAPDFQAPSAPGQQFAAPKAPRPRNPLPGPVAAQVPVAPDSTADIRDKATPLPVETWTAGA